MNDWKKTIGDVLDSLQGYDGEIRELIDYIRNEYLLSHYDWDELALETKEKMKEQLDTLADLVDKENP